jgi:hypothetical protein
MAEPIPTRAAFRDDRSIGDLVTHTVRDLTHLVRCELDLAKAELRSDARRIGLAAILLAMAGFAGGLVLVLLCFAFAYGLMAVGIWSWAAFLIVAGVCVVLAGAAIALVAHKVKAMTGLRQTKQTVQAGLAILHREGSSAVPAGKVG